MLRLNNISFCFEGKNIFKNFSACFEDGKITAITGTSGIGKTTLLNLLAGLLKPTQGTIESTFERTAYIFQDPQLFPWLSALENVNIVCNDKEKAKRVLEALFDEKDVFDKYPDELSGGMKQRVSIARAVSYSPDVIFMDEPFRGLDEKTKATVRDFLINYIRSRNKTAIIVTHSAEDLEFCDSVLDLNENSGKILQKDN